MAQNHFQLKASAPAIYEKQKVPAIFDPLAIETLKRVYSQKDLMRWHRLGIQVNWSVLEISVPITAVSPLHWDILRQRRN